MGKKSKPATPAQPDYAALTGQQEASNMRQFETMLNAGRVDTNTPTGSTSWQQGPDGRWTLNQQLSDSQQGLYDQDQRIMEGRGNIAEGMMGNVANQYGTQFNAADYFNPQGLNYDQNTRQNASDAAYRMNTRYMDPQYAQDESRLHQRMTAQGFNMQDAAYGDQMDKFSQGKERAYAQARDSAYMQGGNEANQELGRARTVADYNNANQLQDINLMTQDRSRPLNELSAFQTGQQIQMPNSQAQYGTPNLQNVDRIGTATQDYQNKLGLYNAQSASKDNFMSGLMGIGGQLGSAYMMSDVRLKDNIRKVGETRNGRSLYTWEWKDSGAPGFGVMAQENPDIAADMGGVLGVDYSQID
jgi:hypothetical protein